MSAADEYRVAVSRAVPDTTAWFQAADNAIAFLLRREAEREATPPAPAVDDEPGVGAVVQHEAGDHGEPGDPYGCYERQQAEDHRLDREQTRHDAALIDAWDAGFEAGSTWQPSSAAGIPNDPPLNPYRRPW